MSTIILLVSYVAKFKPRMTVLIKADGITSTNALFWVWILCKLLREGRFVIPINSEFKEKNNFPMFLIICVPKRDRKQGWKLLCLPCWYIFFFLNGTHWLSTLKKIHYSPPFSVNNRLSLFIPLPSSVPPSPAFSFSPLSLWLRASQHQRESSDLWPQQPTLNLAKEGEHPVCSLAGPE